MLPGRGLKLLNVLLMISIICTINTNGIYLKLLVGGILQQQQQQQQPLLTSGRELNKLKNILSITVYHLYY